MAQILAALRALSSQIGTIFSLVNQILGIVLGIPASEDQQRIISEVDDLWNSSVAVSKTNADIYDLIATNQASLTSQLDDIEATLATIQSVGVPTTGGTVTVGGADPAGVAAIADAVWHFEIPFSDLEAADALQEAQIFAHNMGTTQRIRFGGNFPLDMYAVGWWNYSNGTPTYDAGYPDWANVLPDDTLLTFLNRETGTTWGPTDRGGYYEPSADVVNIAFPVTVPMSEGEFQLAKGAILSSLSPAAPVYTSLADVTYGDSVRLESASSAAFVCHGVLVVIDGVPQGTGTFTFDNRVSYRNIGQIVFLNGDTDGEFPQVLGYEQAIYFCKAMDHATSVAWYVKPGVTGDIYPITINSRPIV